VVIGMRDQTLADLLFNANSRRIASTFVVIE
jgi:hypothetical protein